MGNHSLDLGSEKCLDISYRKKKCTGGPAQKSVVGGKRITMLYGGKEGDGPGGGKNVKLLGKTASPTSLPVLKTCMGIKAAKSKKSRCKLGGQAIHNSLEIGLSNWGRKTRHGGSIKTPKEGIIGWGEEATKIEKGGAGPEKGKVGAKTERKDWIGTKKHVKGPVAEGKNRKKKKKNRASDWDCIKS